MRARSVPTYVTLAALAAGVLFPLLVLLPFGWLWLWERGYVLHWFAAALVTSILAFGSRLLVLGRLKKLPETSEATAEAHDLTPRESAAQNAVEQVARTVDPAKLDNRDALLNLAITTIETVARHMHPGEKDPVWNFTVPEALTLIERVSRRLRPAFIRSIPLGDQLTVAQAIRLYGWSTWIDTAERAYDIWRMIRLLNPLTAATQEIRERLSKAAYEGLREELAKRLAVAYVREVGQAAIDLYSGRLRVTEAELAEHISKATRDERATAPVVAEPLRFLIAGQVKAGKSSLINALSDEVRAAVDALPATGTFTSYAVRRDGTPELLLIDSPGIEDSAQLETLAAKAAECDLLLWVVAANRADRELDRAGISAVRDHFAVQPKRRMPPVLLVITHIDRLRPLQEWSPPYDIVTPKSEKAGAIRAAMEAAASDLSIDLADAIPICLAPGLATYNVDTVWAKIVEILPAARSAKLLRCITDATPGLDWRRLIGQAVGAGRLVAGTWARGARG